MFRVSKFTMAGAAILLGNMAFAQTAAHDTALSMLVSNLTQQGVTGPRGNAIAHCFIDRMDANQAAAFVAAQTSADREAVINSLTDQQGASQCVAEALAG